MSDVDESADVTHVMTTLKKKARALQTLQAIQPCTGHMDNSAGLQCRPRGNVVT